MRNRYAIGRDPLSLTEDLVEDNPRVVERDVSELRPAVNVTQRKDMRLSRAEVFIHDNCAIGRGLYAGCVEPQVGGHGSTTCCGKQSASLDGERLSILLVDDGGYRTTVLHLSDCCAGDDLDPVLCESTDDRVGDIFVFAHEEAVSRFDDRYLAAEMPVDGRELQAQVSPADHYEAFRKAWRLRQVRASDEV